MATHAALSRLPPEVLAVIMAHLDNTQTLKNFVQTCQYLHKVFNDSRRSILFAITNEMINVRCGVAIEADECEAAAMARISGHLYEDDSLLTFLDRYRIRRAQRLALDQTFQTPSQIAFPTGSRPKGFVTRSIKRKPLGAWPDLTINLAHLQRMHDRHLLIQQCVEKFCPEVLHIYPKQEPSEERHRQRSKSLSPIERRRVYRAFYRFELYHQIYHGSRQGQYTEENVGFTRDAVWLCTFPPHEIEEIATVYQWLDDGWRTKFIEIDPDLAWWQCRELYVEEGLAGYLKAMAEQDSEELVRMSQRCKDKPDGDLYYLGSCLAKRSPFHDCWGPSYFEDGYPYVGAPLTFNRDHPDCPNYGWIWSYRFKMTGEFYRYKHSALRRVGHVMWDKSRLETWDVYKTRAPRLEPDQQSIYEWILDDDILQHPDPGRNSPRYRTDDIDCDDDFVSSYEEYLKSSALAAQLGNGYKDNIYASI